MGIMVFVKDEEVGLPDKLHLEELKYDKMTKDNKELVLRCKELDIKLKSKESQCANLQLKASEDGAHITDLGNIIDKLRADISKLLAEFSKQDPHSSLVEEVFTLLEEFIQTDCPQTPKALDILLEMLTHFKDGAVSEEKFSASMLGAVIPRCYAAETRQLGHKCFHLLLRIHAGSAGEGAPPPPMEEEGVRGQVVCQVVTGGEHLASLLASLCDHLASCGHTRGLALELVTLARDTVPVSAIPDLVTKLVTAIQQEEGDQEV